MLNGIFPAARIQGIAVGQKRLSAAFLYQVRHGLGIIGPEIAHISQLAEMHLDCYKFSFHIDLVHPCRLQKALQLFHRAFVHLTTKICKIYLCFFDIAHDLSPLLSQDLLRGIHLLHAMYLFRSCHFYQFTTSAKELP